jgi:acetyl esterase/lipase
MLVRAWSKRRPPQTHAALAQQARGIFGTPRAISALWRVGRDLAVEQTHCGVACERVAARNARATLLYLHGGGYVAGSPQTHRPITFTLTRLLSADTYVPDYRLAPGHPFPAAIDDAFDCYRALSERTPADTRLVLAGDSAGGGLAIATAIRARDAGVRLPSVILTFSPWIDLTPGREPHLRKRERFCDMFYAESFAAYADAYLQGADPRRDLASPLYAKLEGLPPLLIEVSDSELLYEEAIQLRERWTAAGNIVELAASAGLPHGWQMLTPFLPEARESLVRAASFVRRF